MAYPSLATLLTEGVGLNYTPVALAYVAARPAGLPDAAEASPACGLWRQAERGVFFAPPEAHFGCPIGLMTQGFDVPPPQMDELTAMVGEMCGVSYIAESEVAFIPKVDRKPAGIVYGPLASLPVEPDVAVLWATPQQAMLLQEALGGATWAEQTGSGAFGRPACGVLPVALAAGKASVSLGCAGMRTFTEIPADRLLLAVPQPALVGLEDRLRRTLAANQHMQAIYTAKKGG